MIKRLSEYSEHFSKNLLRMVPDGVQRVLDVGCATGRLGLELKKRGVTEVWGVELNRDYAEEAKTRLDTVICRDISDNELSLPNSHFDCVIFADVLEHLVDPWAVVGNSKKYLRPGGWIVASIPNIRHVTIILGLILGRWTYTEHGLLDRTHLRFFTKREVMRLFDDDGFHVEKIRCNLSDHRPIAILAWVASLYYFRNFLSLQYHVRVRFISSEGRQ